MKRHVKEIHDEDCPFESQKQFACKEVGCEKVFRFESKLQMHEESHGKLLQKLCFTFVSILCQFCLYGLG